MTNDSVAQIISVENGQFRPPASFSISSDVYVITAHPIGCALILTEARWAFVKSQIDRWQRESPEDSRYGALRRVVIGNCSPLESTEDGCIRIPQMLVEHCGISDQIVWVTPGSRNQLWEDSIQLCNPAYWARQGQKIKN